jgi:hypothetical protein
MKLSTSQVERALHQFEAQALPDNHPSVAELNRVFGEHTFFLDGRGLHIVEPAVPIEDEGEAGQVVKVASWQDENCTRLTPHKPEYSDVIVELGPDASGLPN